MQVLQAPLGSSPTGITVNNGDFLARSVAHAQSRIYRHSAWKRIAVRQQYQLYFVEHKPRGIAIVPFPLKSYCTGLLLPGERKSVEPMAARLYPGNVRQAHQSLHHSVADAPWSDEDVLEAVRHYVLSSLQKQGPIAAWIVDDTGFVKKGTHSVGANTTVLRTGWETGELPSSREFVGQHAASESSDRLAPLLT